MNLGELFTQTLDGLGKDQYGGYVKPGTGTTVSNSFPDTINQVIQPGLMNSYTVKFEESRILSIDVRPFIKTLGDPAFPNLPLVPWSSNSVFAYAQFPSDFWYFSDAHANDFVNSCTGFTQKFHSVEWVDRARWDFLLDQELEFPTIDRPVASIQNGQIVFCPAATRMQFTYLRKPLDVYFDYDIVSGTVVYLPPGTVHANASVQPTGSASLSVELEWPDSVHNEILARLIQWFGRTIQNQIDMTMPSSKP